MRVIYPSASRLSLALGRRGDALELDEGKDKRRRWSQVSSPITSCSLLSRLQVQDLPDSQHVDGFKPRQFVEHMQHL